MHILITNDDGINAPGLRILSEIADTIAGSGGEVWTVAPAFEQSGVGHCISYSRPTMMAELGPRRFALEGSPADCVLVGLHDVMRDTPPDLVLSGVNRGNNAGQNTLYSGTIGAAMEAALQGIPAVALSQFYGPRNVGLDQPFEAAARHGADVIRRILAADKGSHAPYRLFYNVNFPPVPADEVTGSAVVAQGFRPTSRFVAEAAVAPNGRKFHWIRGGQQDEATGPDTDVTANLEGRISITPMRADLTAHDALAELEGSFA